MGSLSRGAILLLGVLCLAQAAAASEYACLNGNECSSDTLSATAQSDIRDSCRISLASQCSDIRDKTKLYSCDVKSYCGESSWVAKTKGCAKGVYDSSVGAIVQGVRSMASSVGNAAKCYADLDLKKKMLEDYNRTRPPGIIGFYEPTAVLSCGAIQRDIQDDAEMLSNHYPEWYKKFKGSPDPTFSQKVENLLAQFKIKRQCYNDQALSEMYCDAAAFLLLAATPAAGGAIARAAMQAVRLQRIADVAGSVKVTEEVQAFTKAESMGAKTASSARDASPAQNAAIANGAQKSQIAAIRPDLTLEEISQMTDPRRIDAAASLISRPLTDAEKKALIAAHNIAPGKGYYEYSTADLKAKLETLTQAGFSQDEAVTLLRRGVAGKISSGDANPESTLMRVLKKEQEDQRILSSTAPLDQQRLAEGRISALQNELAGAEERGSSNMVISRASALISEQSQLAVIKAEGRGLKTAIEEYAKNRPLLNEVADPDAMKTLLKQMSVQNASHSGYLKIIQNAGYAGMDSDKILDLIQSGAESGIIGKPQFALKTVENGLSRSIDTALASVRKTGDPDGLLRYQALKDTQARLMVYERRYQETLRLRSYLETGKEALPKDWFERMLDSETYQQYNDEAIAVEKSVMR